MAELELVPELMLVLELCLTLNFVLELELEFEFEPACRQAGLNLLLSLQPCIHPLFLLHKIWLKSIIGVQMPGLIYLRQ